MITCKPQTPEHHCTKCNATFIDTIRHFVTVCTVTHEPRSDVMTQIINSFHIQLYLELDNMANEHLLQTLYGKNPKYEFDNKNDRLTFTILSANFLITTILKYF